MNEMKKWNTRMGMGQSGQSKLSLLALLGLIGTAVTAYQTYHFHLVRSALAGFSSFCNINDLFNCTAVESSRFAEIAFGFPLSAAAMGWFLAWVWSAWSARGEGYSVSTRRTMLLFTGIALAMSVVFFLIMILVLKKLCLLCLGVDAVNVIAFVVALSLPKSNVSDTTDSFKQMAWTVCIGMASAALMNVLVSKPSGITQQNISDIVMDFGHAPVLPLNIEKGSPGKGPEGAPITVVKFSDFQCPACRRGAYVVNAAFEKFPGKIRFVFKNYPLDSSCNSKIQSAMHPLACPGARMAICAHEQGRFDAVYRLFFDHQEESKTEADLLKLTVDAGVDQDRLKTCMESENTKNKVLKDIEEGNQLNIESTPTFFINGRRMEGAFDPQVWSRIIESQLSLN